MSCCSCFSLFLLFLVRFVINKKETAVRRGEKLQSSSCVFHRKILYGYKCKKMAVAFVCTHCWVVPSVDKSAYVGSEAVSTWPTFGYLLYHRWHSSSAISEYFLPGSIIAYCTCWLCVNVSCFATKFLDNLASLFVLRPANIC